MERIKAYNIVRAISSLSRTTAFNYINPRNKGLIRVVDVHFPDGPIKIRRYNPNKGETFDTAVDESISKEMIWRVANAINEGEPFNIDRIVAASYNTRSALETLMALTPQFYFCYPGRIKEINGHTSIEVGHKHLLWLPSEPHDTGILVEKEVSNMTISEIPFKQIVYDSILLPENLTKSGIDIDVVRRHTQIQIALYLIGLQLGYRTWIAQNDKGILYKEKPLVEQQGVISSLTDGQNIVSAIPGAAESARFIDCIWFQNHRFMPAVMEVEHSTGITSGLDRMMGLYETIPAFQTRYVIVAPDADREKVIDEINRPQFRELKARYFPYSSVEELYYLCVHRKITGVNQAFLDSFMEEVYIDI